jgi:predicted enzyme related to lactoylglutathione lyase
VIAQKPSHDGALQPIALVEFPADDPDRARMFWSRVLGVKLEPRSDTEGQGWQTQGDEPALGVHERGRGPGDRFSLPYFGVDDLRAALDRLRSAGGEVIHPGEQWAICRDSEGSPFGLVQRRRSRGHRPRPSSPSPSPSWGL